MAEQIDARKDTHGRAEALKLGRSVSKLVVARGRKVESIDLKKERLADDDLADRLLGPTGNLRAPTVRKGKTLLVGFNDEMYGNVLG